MTVISTWNLVLFVVMYQTLFLCWLEVWNTEHLKYAFFCDVFSSIMTFFSRPFSQRCELQIRRCITMEELHEVIPRCFYQLFPKVVRQPSTSEWVCKPWWAVWCIRQGGEICDLALACLQSALPSSNLLLIFYLLIKCAVWHIITSFHEITRIQIPKLTYI